jgi:hypothetical protein
VLVTKTVMIVVQSGYYSSPRPSADGKHRISDLNNFDPHLWVYDKASGEMLAEIVLPANATGAPISRQALFARLPHANRLEGCLFIGVDWKSSDHGQNSANHDP